jgi:hypothetical protein
VIIVDTMIWIDHLHSRNEVMFNLLDRGEVLLHPFVRAEIALGSLRDRSPTLAILAEMPKPRVASTDEVLVLVESRQVYASGIGLTDVHLLASAMSAEETYVWTLDKRLAKVAQRLGVAATFLH